MGLYLPPTIDLRKDQLKNQEYGIENINKLLEEEFALLKALKSGKRRESLPYLEPKKSEKTDQVEGLKDYKKRVEQVKNDGQERDRCALTNHKACIGPFSEAYHDYTKGKRIVAKGEVPFFKVNLERTSLSYRLPKLTDFQVPKTANNIVTYQNHQIQTPVIRRSRKGERTRRLSGRPARTLGKLTSRTDLTSSASEQDSSDITDSLKVQYCTITAREYYEQRKDAKPMKREMIDSKLEKKTFHLACTRDTSKQPIQNDDRECSFCASSVYIHRRYAQSQASKSRYAKSRPITTTEKTFLPQIKPDVLTQKEVESKDCATCRKRVEQAEQNRLSLALPTSQRGRERTLNSNSRKTNSRPVTKEATQQNEKKATDKLPLFECAAYMHEDGSLSLLPGAFMLHDNDYNIWSRKRDSRADSRKLQMQVCNGL